MTAKPATASTLGSEAPPTSELPLDKIDLDAAASLIKDNEGEQEVPYGTPSPESPLSNKKLESLRANTSIVPAHCDQPQKKFTRPPSAADIATTEDVSSFKFGHAVRNTGNLARPQKVQTREQLKPNPAPVDSNLPEKTTSARPTKSGKGSSPPFQFSAVNMMPLDFKPSLPQEESDNKNRMASGSSGNTAGRNAAFENEPVISDSKPGTSEKQDLRSDLSSAGGSRSTSEFKSPQKGTSSGDVTLGICHQSNDQQYVRHNVSHDTKEKGSGNLSVEEVPAQPRDSFNHINTEPPCEEVNEPATRRLSYRRHQNPLYPSRVSKAHHRFNTHPTKFNPLPTIPNQTTAGLSEDTMFMLLMQRSREHQASKIRAAEKQKEMAHMIHQLCQDNDEYEKTLKSSQLLQQSQLSTIDEYKCTIDDLKGRFTKFKNFVKGLTSDFETFRKDAQAIRKTHEDAEKSHKELASSLECCRSGLTTANNSVSSIKTETVRLSQKLNLLESTSEQLNETRSVLCNERERLENEKVKTARLEAQLKAETDSLHLHLEDTGKQQREINGMLSLLPSLIEDVQKRLSGPTDVPPALSQCLSRLEGIAEEINKDPERFHKIVIAMNAQAERIVMRLDNTVGSANLHSSTANRRLDEVLIQVKIVITEVQSQATCRENYAKLEEASRKLEIHLAETQSELMSKKEEFSSLITRDKSLLDMLPHIRNEIQALKETGSPAAKQLEHYRSQADQNRVMLMWANSEKAEAIKNASTLKEELSTKEKLLDLAENEVENLNGQKTSLAAELKSLEVRLGNIDEEEIASIRLKAVEQEAIIHNLEVQMRKADRIQQSNQRDMDKMDVIRRKMEEEHRMMADRLESSLQSAAASQSENESLQKDLRELQTARAEAAKVPALRARLDQQDSMISSLQCKADQVSQQQEQMKAQDTTVANLTQEISLMSQQIIDQEQLQNHILGLENSLGQAEARLVALESTLKSTGEKASHVDSLESQVGAKSRKIDDLQEQLKESSRLAEEANRLRSMYHEISQRNSELRMENTRLQEASSATTILNAEISLKDQKLKHLDGICEQLKEIQELHDQKDAELKGLKAQTMQKDIELDRFQAEAKRSNDSASTKKKKKVNENDAASQESVWHETTWSMVDQVSQPLHADPERREFQTPAHSTNCPDKAVQYPDPPEVPPQRRHTNVHVEVPQSSAVVNERLAAAHPSERSTGVNTTDTTVIPETQHFLHDLEEYGDEGESELSDPPESSPIKKTRSVFVGSLDDRHDDLVSGIQSHSADTDRQTQLRRQNVLYSSSRPSTQGEEMLFERHSQRNTPNGPFKAHAQNPTLMPEQTGSSVEGSFASPTHRITKAGRRMTAAPENENLEPSSQIGPGPRRLRVKPHVSGYVADPITDQTPLEVDQSPSSQPPAAGILKQKHQPNTGAKRQLDSDSNLESPQPGPSKIAKRSLSNMDVKRPVFGPNGPPSFLGQPFNGAGSPDLPRGGKKGRVGSKSSHGASKQKGIKKPRKGSRGDQYGARFGQAIQ
ncbi:MAG: hypothetical protein Q9227_002004 [Pyrenula ochraceoflavens]